MSCGLQTGGKRGGSQLEPLVLTGGNLKGGLVLGGGDAGEYPGAYGAAAQAGGSVFPVSAAGGGSRRVRRLSRRKGHARKARTRSTCAGGSKKRKSKKHGGSKKHRKH